MDCCCEEGRSVEQPIEELIVLMDVGREDRAVGTDRDRKRLLEALLAIDAILNG